MKTPRLLFGFYLAGVLGLLVGAPSKDVQFSTGKKDSPTLPDKKRGSAPDGPSVYDGSNGQFDDFVEIVGVKEAQPDAKGSRKVTVRVHYALLHYPKGMLALGFNLKSATQFVVVGGQQVMAGIEEVELSATIVPVTWPKNQPFKLSVGLTAEPHPGQTSLLATSIQVMKPIAAPAKVEEAKK